MVARAVARGGPHDPVVARVVARVGFFIWYLHQFGVARVVARGGPRDPVCWPV